MMKAENGTIGRCWLMVEITGDDEVYPLIFLSFRRKLFTVLMI